MNNSRDTAKGKTFSDWPIFFQKEWPGQDIASPLGGECVVLTRPSLGTGLFLPGLSTVPDDPQGCDCGDPFDRMLVAQARRHGLCLVTDDPKIQRLYEIDTIPAKKKPKVFKSPKA